MKQRIALLFFVLWIMTTTAGAANVSGLIWNTAADAPEPFATVRLFAATDTLKPVGLCAAGEDGRFSIAIPAAGEYRLRVNAVGCKVEERTFDAVASRSVDLGRIAISTADNELGEVTVTAARPVVNREIDRLSYDVQADEEAKTGPLMDILKKVPLVTVDALGNIKIKGQSNFKIYKNGRPNKAYSNNAKDIFESIPASSIKKIEVITDPGAREDAEGSTMILNIVTMSDTYMRGIMGSVNARSDSRFDFLPTGSLWLTGQLDKVTVNLSGGFHHFPSSGNYSKSKSTGTYTDTGNTLSLLSRSTSTNNFAYVTLEASYEPDTLNLFTLSTTINPGGRKANGFSTTNLSDDAGETIYSYRSDFRSKSHNNNAYDLSLNYQRSTRLKGETITLSYMLSSYNQHSWSSQYYSEMAGMPVDYTGILGESRSTFLENTAQIDWARPINDQHKFDVGLKYINRNSSSRSRNEYVESHVDFTDFSHSTQVAAAYFDYRMKIGAVGFRAGLRYEYSRLAAKFKDNSADDFHSNLNDWVPNAALSWDINDRNTLKFSYNTTIYRPSIGYLSPAVSENPYMVTGGNPHLKSARYQTLNLNYSLMTSKIYLESYVFCQLLRNGIGSVRWTEGDVIYSSYGNRERSDVFYAGCYVKWTISEKTQIGAQLSGGSYYYKSPESNVSLQRWSFNSYVEISQRLPWNLRASASFYGNTGYTQNIYRYSVPQGGLNAYYDLSLQRSFLPKDRLTVRLFARNLGMMHQTDITHSVNSTYIGRTEDIYSRRAAVGVNISLKFGSLNAQVKKVSRGINNDDLKK